MKSYKTLAIVLTLTACLMFGFGFGEQGNTYSLKYNTEAGKVIKYKTSGNGEQEVDAMGNVAGATTTSEGSAEVKTVKVTGNVITFELVFTDFSVTQESDMPGAPDPDFSSQLNLPLILETGLRGENPDLKNIIDLPVSDQDPVPVTFNLMGLIIELPEKQVKVNDTWKATQKLIFETAAGSFESESDYDFTLAGVEKKNGYDCVKITGKSTGKMTGNASMGGMDFDMEGDENSTYVIYFAHKEGIVVEWEGDINMDMIADIPAAGASISIVSKENTKIIIDK